MDQLELRKSKSDKNAPSDENANRTSVTEFEVEFRNTGIVQKDLEDEMENRCGWWKFKPNCAQTFRSPKWILAVFSLNFILQSVTSNGILPSIISSLERQFRLSSTDVGLIVSSFDIAMVLCIIPVTYFGSRGSRPRWLGFGGILCGIGCFIFAVPHFASPLYEPSSADSSGEVCSSAERCEDPDSLGGSTGTLYYVFILGQVCQGIGAAPLFALGVSYLDDSLDPKTSPVYIGILMSMSLVGTAAGFAAGGQMLNLYTEFDRMDTSELAIEPGDPTWVGAWWPGYLFCAVMLIIDGVLIMGFPKKMPGAVIFREERNSQLQRQWSTASSMGRTWQRYFSTIFTNWYFLLMSGVACMEGMIVVGFGSFMAKYVEYEFNLTTAFAGIYTGVCLVFGGGLGMTLGGILVKRLNLDCRRVVKFCAVVTCLWFVPVCSFLWHCPVADVAGVYLPYNDSSSISVVSACNQDCHCDTEYSPVCDTVNNIQYFSACHAGCQSENRTSCWCISSTPLPEDVVTAGPCGTECTTFLGVFLFCVTLTVIGSFVIATPQVTASMRSIPEEMRPLGLGVLSLIGRIFGSIPIPIIFGAMIDSTCMVWEEQTFCDGTTQRGSCQIYNLSRTGLYLFIGGVIPKLIGFAFLIGAGCVYHPETEDINLNSTNISEPKGLENEVKEEESS